MVAGLILAAGESSRMQSPKALLKLGGVTFAERIASIMRGCRVNPVFLIAGAHIKEIRERLQNAADFSIVYNARYDHGQISSLKEGLRQLPTGSGGVLVWPVDQPLVKPDTVSRIIAGFEREAKAVVIPSFQGNHGHPVLYGLAAVGTILRLRKDQTARDIRSIHKDHTLFVEVDDPGILIDIDTPEDFQKHITP